MFLSASPITKYRKLIEDKHMNPLVHNTLNDRGVVHPPSTQIENSRIGWQGYRVGIDHGRGPHRPRLFTLHGSGARTSETLVRWQRVSSQFSSGAFGCFCRRPVHRSYGVYLVLRFGFASSDRANPSPHFKQRSTAFIALD